MLINPLTKNALKSHEAISDGLKPPRVPMARTMATGPEAANVNATTALAPWKPLKSETTWRRDGGRAAGRSRGMAIGQADHRLDLDLHARNREAR
jgi:hypothetical protein